MGRRLVINECRMRCEWVSTGERIDGDQVFRCEGCRSEWTRAEEWTPRNWDGSVSPEVKGAKG